MIEIYTDENGNEWEFYQDEEGKWWWCHFLRHREFVNASNRGYILKNNCLKDAHRYSMKAIVPNYRKERKVISAAEHKARRAKKQALSLRSK